MEFNQKYWDQGEKEEKTKQALFRSGNKGFYFCVFRIGKKFKQLGQISGFQKHMQREIEVPNADHNRTNENKILIGDPEVYEDVYQYIQGAKLRSNSIIARELLLTASPDFFRGMPEYEKDQWIYHNVEWLQKTFGDNVRYAVAHKDEKTWHIHALIVPKFIENGRVFLSHTRYFDGPEKLRNFQDIYSDHMQTKFKSLNRGIRNSKAKHIEIKHFYGIINNVKSRENADTILKNDILIQAKLKGLNGTLEAYRKLLDDKESTLEDLAKQLHEIKTAVKEIKKDRDIYKSVVKQLSQQYKLPQNAIEKALKHAQEVERER